jgi:hypothetical protein
VVYPISAMSQCRQLLCQVITLLNAIISLQNVLEKCVLQYVDSADINVVKSAARCVAFLPLLGGGGSLGANHVSRWKQQQQKVCATLHCILDEAFDNVREIPVCFMYF